VSKVHLGLVTLKPFLFCTVESPDEERTTHHTSEPQTGNGVVVKHRTTKLGKASYTPILMTVLFVQ